MIQRPPHPGNALMQSEGRSQFQIAKKFLEDAHFACVAEPLKAVEALFPHLDIEPGGPEHFYLAFADLKARQQKGEPYTQADFEKRYPDWHDQIAALNELDNSVWGLRRSARIQVENLLASQGWRVKKVLKESAHSLVCVAHGRLSQPDRVLKVEWDLPAMRGLQREYNLLRNLPSQRFVRVLGFTSLDNAAWIVIEHERIGNLAKQRHASHEQIWALWLQCARALSCLHRRFYCHNDIKASNILIHARSVGPGRVRLGDLFLATAEGKVVRRAADCWDHPHWQDCPLARGADDVYRLAMTIAWLLDPDITEPGLDGPGQRLALLGSFPKRFATPLRLCLQDRRTERVSNGMELVRMLRTI